MATRSPGLTAKNICVGGYERDYIFVPQLPIEIVDHLQC
jgi:hypothetical protein